MSYPESQPGYTPNDAGFAPQPPPQKRRGCFFYGCITLIVLFLLAVVAFVLISWMTLRYANAQIEKYTSTQPIAIPKVELSEDDQKAIDDRWTAFKAAVDKGEAAELVLTADEINALINENEELKGKVFIKLEDEKASGDVSIPLPKIPLLHTEGRYLNGKATLTGFIRDGDLVVHAQDVEVNGEALPAEFQQQLATQNLAKDAANNPDMREKLQKIESFEIKDSKVYIKSRAKKSDAEKDEPKAEEKTEPKPEEKAEPKAEEKAEPKADEKAEPKPEPTPAKAA